MRNLDGYLEEVTDSFLSSGVPLDPERENYLREKNYSTKYRLYNLDRPKFRKRIKEGFSFSELPIRDQNRIWSHIFKNTEYLALGSFAIDHFKKFQNKKSYNLMDDWPILKSWISRIENWVHGDMIASLYCDLLSLDQARVYPELEKWSKHKSPWRNRMAILSLLYYYNPKRNLIAYNKIIKFIEPHLGSDHYYLQKAIGWNLRELSKAYPKEYEKFMHKHLLKISATAFSTAVEKVPEKKKGPWKQARKESRLKVRK